MDSSTHPDGISLERHAAATLTRWSKIAKERTFTQLASLQRIYRYVLQYGGCPKLPPVEHDDDDDDDDDDDHDDDNDDDDDDGDGDDDDDGDDDEDDEDDDDDGDDDEHDYEL